MSGVPPRLGPMEFDPASIRATRVEDETPPEQPESAVEAGALLPEPSGPPLLPLAGWALGGLLLLALLWQAYGLIAGLFVVAPPLGYTALGLALLVVVALIGWIVREALSLRRLRRVGALRARADLLEREESHGRAEEALAELRGLYGDRPGLSAALRAFAEADSDQLNDAERLRLFGRTVLEPLDRAAHRQIVRAARDVSLLTAFAPLGLLDTLIVAARTVMLTRVIARLYGVRPGLAASVDLLRLSLRNAALAGVGDVVSHTLNEALHGSLLRMVSTKAGQGAVNGLLVARFGLACALTCRPLPHETGREPSLRRLREELLAGLAGER